MYFHLTGIISFSLIFGTSCKTRENKISANSDKIVVASYYFPNYHTGDLRNEKLKGKNWSEWELVKTAQPRFPGHHQPNVPAWGYVDEKDPKVMAMKINAAVENGIDCFIFDWYMYEDGPFLNRCIDEGFLNAPNNRNIQFAIMWANHDWIDIQPYTLGTEKKLLYPGKVSPRQFEGIGDFVIQKYFNRPNYLKINGKPYFSVYDIQKFVESFGSIEATKAAMDRLGEKAREAGLKGIHWNLVAWGNPILPGEKAPENTAELIRRLGFNSATSYVWIHHTQLPETQTDYNWVRDRYFAHWEKAKEEYGVPYFPNGPRMLNINCWNEWTEGSYLEPDTVNGMKYLEAVNEVFK